MYVPGISGPLSPSLEAIIFLEPIDMALNTGIADTLHDNQYEASLFPILHIQAGYLAMVAITMPRSE